MNVRKARAIIAIGADSKQLEKELAQARKKMKAFRNGAKKLTGKIFKGVGGIAKGAFGALSGGLGIEAAGGLVDFASDLIGFEKTLTRFQITAGKSSAEMASFRQSILDVAKATGVGQGDILEGAQAYVDLTGDVKGAEKAMSTFARVAQASGSSVSDIAAAAAAMQQSLGINADELEATFSGMITQGKAGAVSLKDFASELASLAPRWAKFNESSTVTGVAQMGAAFQVARQGFGSASEAATGLEALMGALTLNAKKFESAGVKIFDRHKDGSKTLRSFDQIINSIGESKLMKDPTRLTKAFGSKEAEQAFTVLNRAKNTITATGNAFDDLVAAGRNTSAVGEDLQTYLESPAGRIEKLIVGIKAAVAEAFTPERIKAFADMLEKALKFAADLVGYIQDIDDFISFDQGKEKKDIAAANKEAFLKGTESMTPDQKKQRAQQLMKQASGIEGDDFVHGGQREGLQAAADELMKQVDPFFVGGRGGLDPVKFEMAMVSALQKAQIVLKADSSVMAKTVSNAPTHRRSPRVM